MSKKKPDIRIKMNEKGSTFASYIASSMSSTYGVEYSAAEAAEEACRFWLQSHGMVPSVRPMSSISAVGPESPPQRGHDAVEAGALRAQGGSLLDLLDGPAAGPACTQDGVSDDSGRDDDGYEQWLASK